VPLFISVMTLSTFVPECLRTRTCTGRSGLPLVGALLITAGLLLGPDKLPMWLPALPWMPELALGLFARLVQSTTRSTPRGA